ncbi:hypothetical protein PFISCL1PPCAC_15251, partial [Pristionchus fissidentatus]
GRYKRLRLFAKGGCEILAGKCEDYWFAVQKLIACMKPDVIMITEYHGFLNSNPHDESMLTFAQERLDYIRLYPLFFLNI